MIKGHNITIKQGKTWQLGIIVSGVNGLPMNLTGDYIRAQIKEKPSSPIIAVIAGFISDALNGVVQLELTDEETALIPGPSSFGGNPKMYYYDVDLMRSDGSVICILTGTVAVHAGVTST